MPSAGMQTPSGTATLAVGNRVAPHHRAAHFVGPAEQAGRRTHFTVVEQLADTRGGHRRVARGDQAHAEHVEAVQRPFALQHLDVAAPVLAEVKVVADHHGSGRQSSDQHLGDKVLGCFARPGFVEAQHHQQVESGRLQ
jgi:hypothetical protein